MENIVKIFLSSLVLVMLTSNTTAQTKGSIQLGLGFGEIPLLSDSFKPAVILGYFPNDQVMINLIWQGSDNITRNSESYNTQFGWEGLKKSSETVGQRIALQARYYFKEAKGFYLTAGAIYNGDDVETMFFDQRPRQVGFEEVNSAAKIAVTRRSATRPGIGLGFDATIYADTYFYTDFTMDWFNSAPKPDIDLTMNNNLTKQSNSTIKKQVADHYQDNFHNCYHQFNLGIAYR